MRDLEQINAAAPHMLLVGMGNPLQERWIDRNCRACSVPVCMAVGGSVRLLVGRPQRAAPWVRAIGYEWLHLLVRQPHKARRYVLGNPKFLARALMQRRAHLRYDELSVAHVHLDWRHRLLTRPCTRSAACAGRARGSSGIAAPRTPAGSCRAR